MKNLIYLAISLLGCAAFADIRAITPVPQARDWWSARHLEKLAEIQKASTNGGIRVVFLGDSITDFWERRFGSHWNSAFGRYSCYKALNLGYSADRTEHVLWRIANGELDGYSAKAIVLMIGTNNAGQLPLAEETPADTVLGIREILNKIREKQPKARTILCSIFPRGWTADDPIRRRNEAVNREIQKFADGRYVFWCDFGSQFLTMDGRLSSEVMPDALHPARRGYDIWQAAVLPYINYLLEHQGPVLDNPATLPAHWSSPVTREPIEAIAEGRAESQGSRWPGRFGNRWWLSRLHERREQIAQSGGSFDLVMLGDSIMHFWEIKFPENWKKFCGNRKVLNCGYAGDKTQHLLWRVENGELDGYKANAVAIMIGTNDNTFDWSRPENVARGVEKIVETVRAKQPGAKIVLMPIFPRGTEGKKGERHVAPRLRNQKTNAVLKQFAATNKDIVWLDLTKLWAPTETGCVPAELMADQIHPTEKGYDLWAVELDKALGK